MKMKKLLAAALAICMLLTMLPICVFAAETTTILDIQYDEENDDVMVYDGNGEPIIPHSEGGYHYWFEDTWAFYSGVLLLSDGTFKVTSDIPLQMMIVNMGVTLIDGDLNAYFVLNGGTISVERMNAEMYNIDMTPGSFYNLGTISGKANISCYGFQSGGEIEDNYPKTVMADMSIENSAVINGGIINAKEYFFNHGTIKKGTITAGEEIYNHGMIDSGTMCWSK